MNNKANYLSQYYPLKRINILLFVFSHCDKNTYSDLQKYLTHETFCNFFFHAHRP